MDELFIETGAAQKQVADFFALFSQGGADLEIRRSNLVGASIAEFRRRIELFLDVVHSLRPGPNDQTSGLILAMQVPDLRAQLQGITAQVNEAATILRTNWRDGTKLVPADENTNFHLADASGNYTQVDLNPNFKRIQNHAQELLRLVGGLLPFCKATGSADLGPRVEALGSSIRQAETLRAQIEASAASVAVHTERIEAFERSTKDSAASAESAVAAIRDTQQRATSEAASIGPHVEQAKATGAAAAALEVQVEAYKPKFEAFQAELDSRNREFLQFQANSKAADDANAKRAAEIDRLLGLADSMISGATTAGLASSLEATRTRYEKRMNGARIGFVVSVVLLVISALPLAAHLLPGILGDLFPKVAEGAHNSWYGVLGKVLLMVPATWLTGFYTKTYADFFHLEREYSHKAALAMSVDGFKRQAPKYEEEITAEVFLEIRSNPARGAAVEPAAHPLYDILSKTIEKIGKKGGQG